MADPTMVGLDPEGIPAEMRAIDRWVAFKATPPKKPGDKFGKVPIDAKTGRNASSTDPNTWSSFDRAVLRMRADNLAGVGFVLNGDGIVGIDLDKCRNPETGEITPDASTIVADLNSFTEVSPSGTGVHVFVRATLPTGRRRKGLVEMYGTERFFTITGAWVPNTPAGIEERQERVDALHARTFAEPPPKQAKKRKPTADERILERARTAKNGEKFARLWEGDSTGYPSDSEADLALCAILSFWARGDAEAVDRLFRQSKRMRPKWDEQHGEVTYGAMTVGKACQPQDGRIERIEVYPGELPEAVRRAHNLLLGLTPPQVFQRDRLLVRLIRLPDAEEVHGVARPAGAMSVHLIDEPYLLFRFAALAEWYGLKRGDLERIDPPTAVASTLLSVAGHWKFPYLAGFVEAPTLRPDGSVLDQPGYDPASKLFLDTGGVKFEEIPENPTSADALTALAVLKAPFAEFPFVTPADYSALLAAILTALVRRSLPNAPMFLFDARTMGSGKTLLADSVSIIATGRTCAVMTQGHDANEDQKRILSVLLQGDLVACIDNVERPLEGADLCVVGTERTYQGRVLGVSKVVKLPSKSLWIATGNNITVKGDLVTRVVLCDLQVNQERPEERRFEGDLRDNLLAQRPELVRAGLTILRAFVVAGRPKQEIPVFGRFEKWSQLVRDPLVWLGEADPLGSVARLRDADPIRCALRALTEAWLEQFGNKPCSVSKAIAQARQDQDGALYEALFELAGSGKDTIDARAVGVFLRLHKGRIVDGRRFQVAAEAHGVARWLVVEVEEEGGMEGQPKPPREESSSEDDAREARVRDESARACVGAGGDPPYPPVSGDDDEPDAWIDLGDGRGLL